jgi:hypothetical protein
MGLPCSYVLQQREAANQPIQLSDLHRHWHVNQELISSNGQVEYNPVFDPEVGRRAIGRTARSGRILSAYEVVEQQRRPQIKHCSLCTPQSHNRMLCDGTCDMSKHNAQLRVPMLGLTTRKERSYRCLGRSIPSFSRHFQAPTTQYLQFQ